MITTLPASGRFIIDTTTDTYDVDVDARVAVYHDLALEAAGVHVDPEVFFFDSVECEVGDVLLFDAAGDAPRTSAQVLGITLIAVEVAA